MLSRNLFGLAATGLIVTGCSALGPGAAASPQAEAQAPKAAAITPAAPPSGGAAPPAAPAATAVGGGGNVQQMSSAWEAARSYRLKVAGTRNGAPFDLLQEVVKPDFDRVQV